MKGGFHVIRNFGALAAVLVFASANDARSADPTSSGNGTAAPDSPVTVKTYTSDIVVDAAGLATETTHLELRPENAASAQQAGQQPLMYGEQMQTLDVTEAYTLKADGRKLPVSPSAIFTQLPQGMPQAPLFDDMRQKTVVFPDVAVGDTVVLTYVTRDKQAFMPGQYFSRFVFNRTTPYSDAYGTVVVPKSFDVRVEADDIQLQKQDTGTTTTYHWSYSAPKAAPADTSVISGFDRSPRLLVSSFKSYDDFSRAFSPLVTEKMAVTPAISDLARQIVFGTSDRREQVQKIYEWVSRHIRYVGIELGRDAIIPHDAAQILASGYGDCKDHVVLFSTLLKAVGIDSEMVLINLGNSYTLPDVPILGELNHAITWIPELQTYADTTAAVAPFGVLPFAEYGKPVVHVVAGGGALRHTPVLRPDLASSTIETTAHIDNDGNIIGSTKTAGTGPFSIALRQIALAIQARGPQQTATAFLRQTGIPGSGNFETGAPLDVAHDFSVTSTFTMGPYREIAAGRRVGMPDNFDLLGSPGDILIGPLANTAVKDTDPTPCYSGHASQDISLEAPAGRHFLNPPPDTSIKNRNLSYVARWSLTDHTVTLHREVTANFDAPLCSGQTRAEMAKAILAIRDSLQAGVGLALTPAQPQQKLQSDLRDALVAEQRGEYEKAQQILDGIIQSSTLPPNVRAALLGERGSNFIRAKEFDQAIAVLDESIRTDSTSWELYKFRGDAYANKKDYAKARADYDRAIAINPTANQALTARASLLVDQHDFSGAEHDLANAIRIAPKAAALYWQHGTLLDDLGRRKEAIAEFSKAIELATPTDPIAAFHVDRGASYSGVFDWDKAIADFSRAIALNGAAVAYKGRGQAELLSGRPDRAIADLSKAADLDSADAYGLLWLFIAESRAGKDAKPELTRRAAQLDLSTWPGAIVAVYLGEISPRQVAMPMRFESWESDRDKCELEFYLGELSLLQKASDNAAAHFRAAVATGVQEYQEYSAAVYEAQRL